MRSPLLPAAPNSAPMPSDHPSSPSPLCLQHSPSLGYSEAASHCRCPRRRRPCATAGLGVRHPGDQNDSASLRAGLMEASSPALRIYSTRRQRSDQYQYQQLSSLSFWEQRSCFYLMPSSAAVAPDHPALLLLPPSPVPSPCQGQPRRRSLHWLSSRLLSPLPPSWIFLPRPAVPLLWPWGQPNGSEL